MGDAYARFIMNEPDLRTGRESVVGLVVALEKIDHRLVDLVAVNLFRSERECRKQVISSADSDNRGTVKRSPGPVNRVLRTSSPRRIRVHRLWDMPHKS